MSTRKVTGLPLPEVPREAPPEVHGLVDAIEKRLGESRIMDAAQALGYAFDYLTRYFCSVAGAASVVLELGQVSDVPPDFEAARSLLKDRLVLLGDKSTDATSKLVRSVFFVGATRKTPTPRRHARLLELGGIPIRGYLNIGDWIKLEPGSGELATDSKANREMLRYLPILKEWVTATTNFFLDAEQSALRRVEESTVEFDLTLAGQTVTVGPIVLPEAIFKEMAPHMGSPKGASADADEPETEQVSEEESSVDEETSPRPEELVSPASTTEEASARRVVTDPPKIEVMGLEPTNSKDEEKATGEEAETDVDTESATPEGSKAVLETDVDMAPPSQADFLPKREGEEEVAVEPDKVVSPSVEMAAVMPSAEVPVSQALRSEDANPDVPDALALPDPTAATAGEATEADDPTSDESAEDVKPVDPVSPDSPISAVVPRAGLSSPEAESDGPLAERPSAMTERLTLPEELEDLTGAQVEPLPEPEPVPPQLPDKEAMSDPVVAALNPAAAKPKSSGPPRDAVLDLFPQVNQPPPEFFDEIDVETDYPEILTTALNDLNGAIESNDSRIICGQMQRSFDILIQFFAGIAGALLAEIDSEALFDFEIEDGRFDLETKIELIVTALSCLEEFWENNDSANLLWSVFYDTLLPATDPNCAYLHTRLLGVEGLVPKPFIEFVDLCTLVPGEGPLESQAECRKLAHHFLPVLSFWLENSLPLFLESEVDYVEEDDGAALSWAAEVGGVTLDGTGSGFWLEVASDRWNLPRPELAPVFVSGDAPEVLLPVFDQLNTALESSDFQSAGLHCRLALDFLIQYFAGCSASLWRQQGRMTEQALELFYPEASLEEKERLLALSLGGISAGSDVGQNLGKLFSKGSLQYRILVQKDERSGIQSVSTWALDRSDVDEQSLLAYLPLLRSWIGAANPWFSAGEQLFEEPSPSGVLEGVVAYGEDFLEMVDPEYVIQLATELLELSGYEEAPEESIDEPIQASTPFTGRLPQLPILMEGPPVLVGHVGRLLESADDRRTSNAWLGSAFEYLIQYYAGLCVSVLGEQSQKIDKSIIKYFNPSASLRQRERLLVACIEKLKDSETEGVQQQIRDVFIKPDGSYRAHTKYLGIDGPASLGENEMLLSYFCRSRHHAGHLSTSELHFGTSILNSWLDASKTFFSSCEHYAEDPGADGQEEIVLELADDYLDMVLPDYAIQIPARGYYEVLYSETDYEARIDVETFFPEDARPDLLGPQEVVLGGAADSGGEELLGAAMDTGNLGDVGDDLFAGSAAATEEFDSDSLFAGAAPTQKLGVDDMFAGAPEGDTIDEPKAEKEEKEEKKPEKPPTVYERRRKKKKKSRKQELGSAVLELYKKERLEKARKRAEARAKKAEAEPSKVKFTLQYRGLKNSKQLGGRGHFGVIELSNGGGGELKGTIEPAHPCVKVSPTRFEGNQVRVVYQVDPSDMPASGGSGITILTQDERVVLRLDALVPTSWWSEKTNTQAIGLMLAPSLLYGAYLLMLMGGILGPTVRQGFMEFAHSDMGALPWGSHFLGWLFAMLAILPGTTAIPAAIKWIFAKLDYSVQEETRWWMSATMMAPTLIMLAILFGSRLWVFHAPPGRLPLLASRGLILLLTFGLNLLASSLFSLQTTMWWEENQDKEAAKKSFLGFWIATVFLGVVVTFFMW